MVLLLSYSLAASGSSSPRPSWPSHLKGTQALFLQSVQRPEQVLPSLHCANNCRICATSVRQWYMPLLLARIRTLTFLEARCVLDSASGSRESSAKGATTAALMEHVAPGQTDPVLLGTQSSVGTCSGDGGGAALSLGSQLIASKVCPRRRQRGTCSPQGQASRTSCPCPPPGEEQAFRPQPVSLPLEGWPAFRALLSHVLCPR